MAEKPQPGPDLQGLKEAARRVAESGSDLQAGIRDLTLTALSSARLDLPHIREVTRSVIEGVGAAAEERSGDAGEVIRQSLDGIGDALSKAGEASTLAIREATGRAAEFSEHDLKRALDDLASLQDLLLDTLGDVAKVGSATLSSMLADFQTHARITGNALGEQLAGNIAALQRLIPPAGREGLKAGAQTAREAAERLGRIASGILAGIEAGRRAEPEESGSEGPDRNGSR
ncbi:MAG: hypothetical protein PVJ15_01750 [Gammaproteobacteria bacterium]|jgi:hypothetical protein